MVFWNGLFRKRKSSGPSVEVNQARREPDVEASQARKPSIDASEADLERIKALLLANRPYAWEDANGPAVVPCLIRLFKDSDYEVRAAAAEALGRIRATQAANILIGGLSDTYAVSEAVALALARIGTPEAITALTSGKLTPSAALELAKQGVNSGFQYLLDTLKSPYRREEAAEALGETRDPRALKPLIDASMDSEYSLRSYANSALGKLGGRRAVEVLITNLKDPYYLARSAAAHSLGVLKAKEAVYALIGTLGDDDEENVVRGCAARALAAIGDEYAQGFLVKALASRQFWVRQEAAFALGEMRCQDAEEPLRKALGDEDERVKLAAAKALQELAAPGTQSEVLEAVKQGNLKKMQAALIDHPQLTSYRDDNFQTPLHIAVSNGDMAMAELLLANDADINAENRRGFTPLSYVAGDGHTELAKFLIAKGAIVDCRTKDYMTPLHLAASNGYSALVELLIANGADVGAHSGGIGLTGTPLHDAAYEGHVEVARILLAHGAEVDARGGDQETPLHRAATRHHCDVAELLLRNGAAVNAMDRNGKTPLREANGIFPDKAMTDLLHQYGGHAGNQS
jgi:HEAT repeat protein